MRLYVDLGVIQNNYNLLRRERLYAVVKADAYGHGLGQVVSRLHADAFCVARAEEALTARRYTARPILVLGYTDRAEAAEAMLRGVTLTAVDEAHFRDLESVARMLGVAGRVQLAYDCGMHRYGGDASFLGIESDVLRVTGVFSHLPSETRRTECEESFRTAAGTRQGAHLAATRYLRSACGAGRAGLGLYGYGDPDVVPAMRAVAPVTAVRDVRAGEYVGYGEAFRTTRASRIAIVGVGYGDGYPRLVNRGHMRIRDRVYPVVGSVCMDVTFLDVTDGDVSRGDEVCVMEDAVRLAAETDRIPYEYLTCWNPRVERVYV